MLTRLISFNYFRGVLVERHEHPQLPKSKRFQLDKLPCTCYFACWFEGTMCCIITSYRDVFAFGGLRENMNCGVSAIFIDEYFLSSNFIACSI